MGKGEFRKKKIFNKFKRKNKNGNKQDDRDDPTNPNNNRISYREIPKDNQAFRTYYKAQDLMKDDEEFQAFHDTLKEPLPVAFRINLSCFGQTQALKNIVESDEFEFSDLLEKDPKENVKGITKGVTKLKWYPSGLAYQINLSRQEIKASEKLLKLQGFLTSEAENGYITRQETVSLIPPIVLDIKPHHKVLDLCAAPGSKTTQILEYLHDNTIELNSKKQVPNQGFVIANDLNNDRCYMLVHQLKRFNLPYFLVTNDDASSIPDLYTNVNGEKTKLKFDRVLADVPCSGDGTLRKNSDIWIKWTPSNANHLYQLQLKIAKRAAEVLAKDGLMVYSTCSFNPVENEVVVLNLLRQSEGALELVDVEEKLEHLKHVNGLEKWVLMQKDLKIVKNYEEVDEGSRNQLRPEMFPPEDVKKYNLKRCVRILPHLQNTGGFFIALLRKKTDNLPWQQSETDESKEVPKVATKKPRLDFRAIGFKEDPFIFMNKDDPEWLKIREFYSISDDFPSHRLFRRSEKGVHHLYYLTESAIDLFKNNEDKLQFINLGIRLFTKTQDKVAECTHRMCQDGVHLIYPYLDKSKIVKISKDEFEKLMNCEVFLDLSTELETETVEKISTLPSGCVVLEYVHSVKQDNGIFKELPIPLIAWKGKSTIRPFVNKEERKHYLRLCGLDISSIDKKRIDDFEERKKRRDERVEQRTGKGKQAAETSTGPEKLESKDQLDENKMDVDNSKETVLENN